MRGGSIALLLTSDEEGPSIDGTVKVVERLAARGERLDYCVVGEPSSVDTLGDMIKNGRRGSLSGTLTVKGVQGHIAYPAPRAQSDPRAGPGAGRARRDRVGPRQRVLSADRVAVLQHPRGDRRHERDPGHARAACSTSATRRRARASRCSSGSRPSCAATASTTTSRGRAGARPFLTPRGTLVDVATAAIRDVTGVTPELSCIGGTSDGRFIADICAELVELGPVNATIHKLDERVRVADLEPLAAIYRGILARLLADRGQHRRR